MSDRVLVVGASGATGRLVVERLLAKGVEVRAIVRSLDALSDHANRVKIQAHVHALSAAEIAEHVRGCSAAVSCLGHNLSFKGLFGHPRRLVTDTIVRLCEAIEHNKSGTATRLILMNTVAHANKDMAEKPPLSQRVVVAILSALLPPQFDNEEAAEYLRSKVGQAHHSIEWVAVRPDALTSDTNVTHYTVHPSPTRNCIFNSGKTSRINVAHFMVELILRDDLWKKWQGANASNL